MNSLFISIFCGTLIVLILLSYLREYSSINVNNFIYIHKEKFEEVMVIEKNIFYVTLSRIGQYPEKMLTIEFLSNYYKKES